MIHKVRANTEVHLGELFVMHVYIYTIDQEISSLKVYCPYPPYCDEN